jgi:hypothetical protein
LVALGCGSDKKSSGAGAAGNAGNTGNAGSNSGSGGGSNGSTAGGFDALWKRASVEINYLDTAAPGIPRNATADYPATHKEPMDGREFEVYQQFKDDKLVTYAFFTGDSGYYRMQQATLKTDDGYVLQAANATHLYTIEDGVLVDSSTETVGTAIVYSDVTHKKYEGVFPPPTWPSRVVEAELPELAQ